MFLSHLTIIRLGFFTVTINAMHCAQLLLEKKVQYRNDVTEIALIDAQKMLTMTIVMIMISLM